MKLYSLKPLLRCLLPCVLALGFCATSQAQIKDQDLDGVSIATKRLDVREIIDSINKNAPSNYAEPEVIAGTYTSLYSRTTDTVFALSMPAYVRMGEKGIYGELMRDSTLVVTPTDNRETKAHFDRTLIITNSPFPAKTSTLALIKRLYEIEDTEHLLFGREGTEDDPYFYILFRPKKKVSIPLLIRPFISSIDKDSLFSYSLLKIRRKNWVLVSYESSLLMAPPATVTELIKTTSFSRARALIVEVKGQTALRRLVSQREWQPSDEDGKYHFKYTLKSDNLLNVSLAVFKKFPHPGGYIGTATFTADPTMPLPAKEVLKPYYISDYSKERGKYSGKD